MKIKTMTASFGRLERATLTLDEGLNVIQAQNESGKSTWAGFLKAMLYGIDTRDRDKKGYLADKNRYQPWSGAPMEGEITLEWGGRDITIRRSQKGSVPFGEFSAVYTGTQEPVPGMTGDTCGFLLTGVSREVFERSAFIGQGGMAVSSTPELEKRIAALVSSGQEDVSFSQAEERLREWSNRRKVNRTVGEIPKLEQERERVKQSLSNLEQLTAAIAQAKKECSALEQARKELKDELYIHERLAQRNVNNRFAQAQEDVDKAQRMLDTVMRDQSRFTSLPDKESLKKYQGEMQYLRVVKEEIKRGETALVQLEEDCVRTEQELADPYFQSLTGPEALHKAQTDVFSAQNGQKKARTLQRLQIVLWGLALLALAGGFFLRTQMQPAALACAGIAIVCVLTAPVLGIMAGKSKKLWQQIPALYGVETPEQISALAEDYAARWQTAQDAKSDLQRLQEDLADKRERVTSGTAALFDFVHTFAPEVKELFGCSAALSMALGMEDRLREAKERLELTIRRRDDLEAQGAQPMDTLEMLHTPERSPEQTREELTAVESKLRRLEQALSRAAGEQSALGDPAALTARIKELDKLLEDRNREYEAISIASKVLTAANSHLQQRLSPALNKTAGEYLAQLTAGRYSKLSLDRDLEPSATSADGMLPRKAIALSAGTADQMYLAVRLAVCELCLPANNPAPLVLDDALVSFDDRRMALAMDCLMALGKERQILLFTCQSREGQYAGNSANVLTL